MKQVESMTKTRRSSRNACLTLGLALAFALAAPAQAQNDKMTPIPTPAQANAIELGTGALPNATASESWHSQYGRHVEHLRRVFGHHTSVADPLMYASQFVQVILGCVHGGMASETTCRETYVASSVELFVNGVPQRSLAEVTTEVSDGAESASRLNAHARN